MKCKHDWFEVGGDRTNYPGQSRSRFVHWCRKCGILRVRWENAMGTRYEYMKPNEEVDRDE